MRTRLLWLLLLGLLLTLIVVVARREGGTLADLGTHDFSSATIYGVLAIFVGGMVLTAFRERLSRALEAALLWILIAGILLIGYTYRTDLRDIGDRVLSEVIPGRALTRGQTVEIARGRGGDFSVAVLVNGARVPMVLDSGASAVVLTYEAAKAAGLPLEVLQYTVNVETANGRTRAAPVTLDKIAVGGLTERSVSALIAQPGQLRTSLLGMSFLNRLESWEVRGDKLSMRGYP
jgi:aspartyl protease family protein